MISEKQSAITNLDALEAAIRAGKSLDNSTILTLINIARAAYVLRNATEPPTVTTPRLDRELARLGL